MGEAEDLGAAQATMVEAEVFGEPPRRKTVALFVMAVPPR
jgi:hypothetical protein